MYKVVCNECGTVFETDSKIQAESFRLYHEVWHFNRNEQVKVTVEGIGNGEDSKF